MGSKFLCGGLGPARAGSDAKGTAPDGAASIAKGTCPFPRQQFRTKIVPDWEGP
jgi:hypothetical protein